MAPSSPPSPEEMAGAAAEFAAEAGRLLLGLFGKRVEVDYKNKAKTDPVSEADRASQDLLTRAIGARYPGHAVLGEEKPKDEAEAKKEGERTAPEHLWVLDPLDGTKNFLNGMAVWACSVAVLREGRPVAGAIFTPEASGGGEGGTEGGRVYRAWEGGGAFLGERKIQVAEDERPTGRRIASLPAAYWTQYRPTGPLRSNLGEVRAPGSIAYELALVARGGLHYALFGGPSIWDAAAGVLLVREAGGLPLLRLPGADRWAPFESFFPAGGGPRRLEDVRRWRRALLVGNPELVHHLAANLRKVNRPRLWYGGRRRR
ncbi:MAG: inositol monophosphatase [bacterium]